MSTERLLQLSIGVQLVLSAFLLYVGQDAVWIPMAIGAVALTAFFLVDFWKVFHLNRFWLNALTLMAAGYCVFDMLQYASSFYLVISTSNALIMVELILLFRQKNVHTYRLLILLSFFQTIVGAVFRQQSSFGFLLIIFLCLSVINLCLLLFYRQHQCVYDPRGEESFSGLEGRIDSSKKTSFSEVNSLIPVVKRQSRFPMCGKLILSFFSLNFFSVFLCLVFFMIMPRFKEGAFLGFPGPGRIGQSGFNDSIRLGDLGPSKQNSSTVCRVEMFKGDSDKTEKVSSLYIRGAALNFYEDCRWSFENSPNNELQVRQPSKNLKVRVNEKLDTRVTYTLEPGRHTTTTESGRRATAFAVWPFVPDDIELFRNNFSFNGLDQRLIQRDGFVHQAIKYQLYAPSIQNGSQVDITPKLYPQEIAPLLQIPTDQKGNISIPTAEKLAKQWLKETNMSVEKNGYEPIARYLERMLRDSGKFEYSIKGQKRNRNIDPIEDFLSEHPVGHCEYFAAALVVMLRSAGIPAEIVVGYLTDEYSPNGHYYQVRQLHAHAWVQVFLPPEQLNKIWQAEQENSTTGYAVGSFSSYQSTWSRNQWQYGGWLRLDPTPAINTEQTQINAFLDWFGSLFDWMNVQWEKYLIKLDSSTQQTQVYEPLIHTITKSKWAKYLQKKFRHFPLEFLVLGIIILCGMLYGVYRIMPEVLRQIGFSQRGRKSRRYALEAKIEFYRLFESKMKELGFIRRPGQTPMNFAKQIQSELPDYQAWQFSPCEIVAGYYAIRFGNNGVSEQWIAELKSQLKGITR